MAEASNATSMAVLMLAMAVGDRDPGLYAWWPVSDTPSGNCRRPSPSAPVKCMPLAVWPQRRPAPCFGAMQCFGSGKGHGWHPLTFTRSLAYLLLLQFALHLQQRHIWSPATA
mmetsp:Transcript_27480/g.49503  ORF Transcript_27480/g.49503 Transcript_27480/m.49503 type:complete len:113 (-) Transcript_27480:1141-1479(-)